MNSLVKKIFNLAYAENYKAIWSAIYKIIYIYIYQPLWVTKFPI